MFLKIKESFLLIFLILLQSCSGGSVGNFLESSFDNLEQTSLKEESKKVSETKKSFKENNKEINKNIVEKKIEEKSKKVSDKEKKLVQIKKAEKGKNSREKKIKKDLQSYKIIFILKDVDPKNPIKEFSTILRNSKVNFEIEKIERFFDSKDKSKKKIINNIGLN